MLFQEHNFALFFGLVTALCSPVSLANKDVDLTANIVSSTFYARMQKVNNALAPVAGIVRSQVIVNVYYE